MATSKEKLANSLKILTTLQDDGRMAIRSSDLTRTHRERLLKSGFLQEVMKGWYIISRPDQTGGESTAWYVSFWGFCADYLNSRFGETWCLSPEQSLLLHAGNQTVPPQLLVRSTKGSNKVVHLPHDTSLLAIRASIPKNSDMEEKEGLRIYSLTSALINASPSFFTTHEADARATLALVRDASEVLPSLLDNGHTTIAGRLAGAFENIDRSRIADDIVQTMRAAGYEVRKKNPFSNQPSIALPINSGSAPVHRLRLMWAEMREPASANFPAPQSQQIDIHAYLKTVDEKFTTDAYHSLSIEGHQVDKELIERIKSGHWSPAEIEDGRNSRNALAAKGYFQAFQKVQFSLKRVLEGEDPGLVVKDEHGVWYREMFQPGVAAGLLLPSDLAGYRNSPVYISNSRYVPPSKAVVRDLMAAYFELITTEIDPAARVVLGHFAFVFIHPYLDGNGRIGRFLMNVMAAAGGYPWMVVPVQRRDVYMEALEVGSVSGDIRPFARFLAGLIA